MDNTILKLAENFGVLLCKKKMFVGVAESCTGGLLAAAFTAISGCSKWFDAGFITYSNEAKVKLLNVSEKVLEDEGAVSEACALAMAQGALINSSKAQIAVAITGLAGPDGGSEAKPVGTVWIAWAAEALLTSKVYHFKGDRNSIREQAVKAALEGLILAMKI